MRRRIFTPEEQANIRADYGTLPVKVIATRLRASVHTIDAEAERLGLTRVKQKREWAHAYRKYTTTSVMTETVRDRTVSVIEDSFIRPPSMARLMAGR